MNRINRRALLLLLTGLVAAVAAALMVYYVANSITKPPSDGAITPVAQVTTEPTRVVIVAAVDIPANTVISPTMMVTGSYPVNLVPADAVNSMSEVLTSTANTNIFSGQVLLRRQFVAASGRTGASVNIPAGKVLVAFPSTDMLNATGAVQAGDHVDIMLSLPISGTTRLDNGASTESQLQPGNRALVAQMTLQNIEVYTIGLWTPPGQQQQANADASRALKIITFVVDPQEALILKYVKDSGGTIDLAVRSALDNKVTQTDPVSLDYLVDLFGFIGLQQPKPSK